MAWAPAPGPPTGGPPEGGAGARIAVRPLTRLKKLVWQSSRLAPFVEELGAVITASHHPAAVLQPMVWSAGLGWPAVHPRLWNHHGASLHNKLERGRLGLAGAVTCRLAAMAAGAGPSRRWGATPTAMPPLRRTPPPRRPHGAHVIPEICRTLRRAARRLTCTAAGNVCVRW